MYFDFDWEFFLDVVGKAIEDLQLVEGKGFLQHLNSCGFVLLLDEASELQHLCSFILILHLDLIPPISPNLAIND